AERTGGAGLALVGLGKSAPGARAGDPPAAADPEDPRDRDYYIDPVLDEAAAAIFYAWPRFPRDVRELTPLPALLLERYGKDFALLAQDDRHPPGGPAAAGIQIPERLAQRL